VNAVPEDNDVQKQLQAGLELPLEKQLYFNGFATAVGAADVVIVLQRNGEPILTLNTSLVIAKELVTKLQGLIHGYEDKTNQKVMSLDEFSASIPEETD